MSNEGDEPAGELLWQQAREKYEDPANGLKSIAEGLGVNRSKLIVEARRRGWKLRGARKNSGTRATILRFKDLLQKRLGQLESQLGEIGVEVLAANSERDIRATNMLVRTLEKVLELEHKERKQRSTRARQNRKLNDAERAELTRRIEKLRLEHQELRQVDEEPPSDGDFDGMAAMGEG